MDDEIGVTPNRTGKVSVVVFRETEMTERLRRIAGALQTLQQPDLERLLFGFAAKGFEEALQFPSMRQVAGIEIRNSSRTRDTRPVSPDRDFRGHDKSSV